MTIEKLKALQIEPKLKRRCGGSFRLIILGVVGMFGIAAFVARPWERESQRTMRAGPVTAAATTETPDAGTARNKLAASIDSAGETESAELTVSGYIINAARIQISPRFLGVVEWIGVKKGDPVCKGQVLARLDDREYKANRYDFMGGSSSGYQSKQAIVSRYTPGSKAVCYVNPRDPVEAVLERGVTPIMWVGLLPLVFVFLGFIGLVSALRKRSNQAGFVTFLQDTRFPANAVLSQLTAAEMSAPVILKPKASPAGKLLATLAIALFWNGIISVFLVQVFKNWRSGHLEWFLVLFLTPFVLIGLGLVVAVFYFLLALFNPRPHLTVSPGVPRLGESLRVEWEVCGRVEALRALRVRLQGREEATYTRGTTTSTDRSVFADLEVAIVTSPQEMRSGSAAVTIPQTLMHSFCGKHNKLLWCVQVHGEIERWPDVREEFPVNVAPAARIGAFPA